jgi:hypothetical protein
MTWNKITESYTERRNICWNMTSDFHPVAVSKSRVQQNNDSNKTCRFDHDPLLYET